MDIYKWDKNTMKLLIFFIIMLCGQLFADTFNISNVAQSVINYQYTNNISVSNNLDFSSTFNNTNSITNLISSSVVITNITTINVTNIVGVELPAIPPTGTSVLKSVNGTLTWVAE